MRELFRLRVALRIEVNTLLGAVEGVPAILRLLDEYKIQGCFFLSLGADHSSMQLKKLIPAQWLRYLPAPMIGVKAVDNLSAIKNAGHEVGLSAYTPYVWSRDAAYQGIEWIRNELNKSLDLFEHIYGERPQCFAAVNWQVNPHLLALEEELDFKYASDVRGRGAFLPLLQEVSGNCPQIPTTLPVLSELLRVKTVSHDKIHEYIFSECQRILPNGEVFSLNAEHEGRDLIELFERRVD